MRKFKILCKDGLLGPEDYRIFEDWSATNKLRERYMRIKDGLILEGKVQEMNNEEIFLMRGRRKNAFAVFSWRTTRWLPINTGSHFCPADLEHFCEFEVSFLVLVM
jgi:hypothetical protein